MDKKIQDSTLTTNGLNHLKRLIGSEKQYLSGGIMNKNECHLFYNMTYTV
jgi:hypothetical protein